MPTNRRNTAKIPHAPCDLQRCQDAAAQPRPTKGRSPTADPIAKANFRGSVNDLATDSHLN